MVNRSKKDYRIGVVWAVGDRGNNGAITFRFDKPYRFFFRNREYGIEELRMSRERADSYGYRDEVVQLKIPLDFIRAYAMAVMRKRFENESSLDDYLGKVLDEKEKG